MSEKERKHALSAVEAAQKLLEEATTTTDSLERMEKTTAAMARLDLAKAWLKK